jgi:hypothetical protein
MLRLLRRVESVGICWRRGWCAGGMDAAWILGKDQ